MLVPLVFAAASQAAAAAVPTGDVTPVASLPSSHEYRSGLAMGFSYGAGLAGASGYPNNSQEIGNPDYYSASGLMAGSYTQIFVMGALSDYLNFGFWYAHSSLHNGDWQSTGDGGGFRIELFPLVGLVPALHGFGVLANLGIGSGTLTSTDPALPQAGGTQSFGGIGLFQEWAFGHLLGGHFAVGPALEFDAIWTRPFEQHGLVGSARLAFYSGP
jgi:hypothetical protein